MTCFYCKGTMEESTSTYFSEKGERIFIVKHVPCQKCKKCGEVVYTGTVVGHLEKITKQLEELSMVIAVVNYSAA